MSVKKIFLMRHGDALNESLDHSDHGRILSERGKVEVSNVSLMLKKQGILPNTVICSDAHRTIQTYDIIKTHIDWAHNFSQHRDLYLCDHEQMLEYLFTLSDSVSSVLIIGHNPACSTFASVLCGQYMGFSTAYCGIFELSTNKPWNEISYNGNWDFKDLLQP